MTTGQRIAAKRKELGLSQEALGEKLGVSRAGVKGLTPCRPYSSVKRAAMTSVSFS